MPEKKFKEVLYYVVRGASPALVGYSLTWEQYRLLESASQIAELLTESQAECQNIREWRAHSLFLKRPMGIPEVPKKDLSIL